MEGNYIYSSQPPRLSIHSSVCTRPYSPWLAPCQPMSIIVDDRWAIPAQCETPLMGKFGSMTPHPSGWEHHSAGLSTHSFPSCFPRCPTWMVIWGLSTPPAHPSLILHRHFPEESSCAFKPVSTSASWKPWTNPQRHRNTIHGGRASLPSHGYSRWKAHDMILDVNTVKVRGRVAQIRELATN